jgi:AbrB family looped-hinge helix DNA binding protein
MPNVMKISPQGQIRIPKKVLDALQLIPGDYVEVDVESGQAILKPRKLIDPSQGWYWTKQWQKIEAEVDKELENGQCSPVLQTAEEGLKWLDE